MGQETLNHPLRVPRPVRRSRYVSKDRSPRMLGHHIVHSALEAAISVCRSGASCALRVVLALKPKPQWITAENVALDIIFHFGDRLIGLLKRGNCRAGQWAVGYWWSKNIGVYGLFIGVVRVVIL